MRLSSRGDAWNTTRARSRSLGIAMPKSFVFLAVLPVLFFNTSVHAQTPDASPEPTLWSHNGSVMYLVANGSTREFYYEKPRRGMSEVGARPNSILFRGQVNNGQYSGTAYVFNPRCGQIPFRVRGAILDNDERVVLTGQAPRVGRHCKTYASYTSNLEFRLLKSIEASQSPDSQNHDEAKPEVRLTDGDTPSTSTAQPSAKHESPSQAKDASGTMQARRPTLSHDSRRKRKRLLGRTTWTVMY